MSVCVRVGWKGNVLFLSIEYHRFTSLFRGLNDLEEITLFPGNICLPTPRFGHGNHHAPVKTGSYVILRLTNGLQHSISPG
jgi:hypothetical protein